MAKKIIAIIPARGGSKGLPGKNIRNLNGKPLICHTIDTALKSSVISDVIVSTDDPEIAEIAEIAGARCPFLRPEFLATDNALAIDNYIYTLNRLEAEFGYNIDSFFVLQPTSPLRSSYDIEAAYELFTTKNADSVVSYTENEKPLHWLKLIEEDYSIKSLASFNGLLNRQDYDKTYYPNGSVYIFRKELILKKEYYSDKSYAYIMPKLRSVDIDTIDDFEYAEFLINKKNA